MGKVNKNNMKNYHKKIDPQTTIVEDLIVEIIWWLTPKSKRGK